MNTQSSELAKEVVGAYSESPTPEYLDLRDRFLATLAFGGAGIKDGDVTEDGARNAEFIADFVGTLPVASATAGATDSAMRYVVSGSVREVRFRAADLQEAQAIQSSAVWLRSTTPFSRGFTESQPAFVVGEASSAWSPELLLASAVRSDDKDLEDSQLAIHRPRPLTRMKSNIKAVERKRPYKPDQISRMQTLDGQSYAIDGGTQRSMEFVSRIIGRAWERKRRVSDNYAPRIEPITHVEDALFSHFNILDKLNELAWRFGRQDRLLSMIDAHFLAEQTEP